MDTCAPFTSLFPAILISKRKVAAALLLLLAKITVFSAAVASDQTIKTVRLDGEIVFIPEIKLTRKINPVTTLLFIGSWGDDVTAKANQESLCAFDLKNNNIIIKSPEKLLLNSTTRVVKPSNLRSFLDEIAWGRRQATQFVFKAISGKRQSAVIELYTDAAAVLFNNGKVSSMVTANSAVDSGGRGYLPIMLEAGENIINHGCPVN